MVHSWKCDKPTNSFSAKILKKCHLLSLRPNMNSNSIQVASLSFSTLSSLGILCRRTMRRIVFFPQATTTLTFHSQKRLDWKSSQTRRLVLWKSWSDLTSSGTEWSTSFWRTQSIQSSQFTNDIRPLKSTRWPLTLTLRLSLLLGTPRRSLLTLAFRRSSSRSTWSRRACDTGLWKALKTTEKVGLSFTFNRKVKWTQICLLWKSWWSLFHW